MPTIEPQNSERIIAIDEVEHVAEKKSRRVFLWFFMLVLPMMIMYFWSLAISPPKAFLPDTSIVIPKGYTLAQTSVLLKEHSLIRSETIFLFTIQQAGKEKGIQSGTYFFKKPVSVFEVAAHVMRGEYGVEQLKITLPEGITTKEMADILGNQLPSFDEDTFLSLTKDKEGYLFPDTYFFYTNATSGPIVDAMEENFNTRTKEIRLDAANTRKSWGNIVIVASLLEEEATTKKDRGLVSGIIWKRLLKNMPLQIDATLGYVTGRGSLELTTSDLRSDSPYNTYTHKGLPPTPISNPGIEALSLALYPTTSEYLYYLSDKNGIIHYAKTFEEHKLNKAKYLR